MKRVILLLAAAAGAFAGWRYYATSFASAVLPAMAATMNQTVTLRKSADGWKVAAFENKVGKVDSLMRR
jgi:hypothetical protein